MRFYRVTMMVMVACLSGCGTTLLGPSPQELLAIEQQRARVAAVFAIAKPYQHANEAEQSDYDGPPRAAPPSPSRTAPAVKATTEPEPNPRPRDNIQGTDAAGSAVVTWPLSKLPSGSLKACRAEAKKTGKRLLVLLHDPSDGEANLWLLRVLTNPSVLAAIEQGWVLHRSTPAEWRTTGPLLLILDPPEKDNGKCKPIIPPADAAALVKLLTY